ncbi:MAG TPA: hypothetical protein VMT92_00380, partial [Steroidobacteraceae bacterium]|nr:hypothetical protein [Steroidobacteraceae bacterium]
MGKRKASSRARGASPRRVTAKAVRPKPPKLARLPLLGVSRDAAAPPALSPDVTLEELAALASAANDVVDPVAGLRAWLAMVEAVLKAGVDKSQEPIAQRCIAGLASVRRRLSCAALTGAEIGAALADAVELGGNVASLRVKTVIESRSKEPVRPSAAMAERHQQLERAARLRADAEWARLGALAKTHNAL